MSGSGMTPYLRARGGAALRRRCSRGAVAPPRRRRVLVHLAVADRARHREPRVAQVGLHVHARDRRPRRVRDVAARGLDARLLGGRLGLVVDRQRDRLERRARPVARRARAAAVVARAARDDRARVARVGDVERAVAHEHGDRGRAAAHRVERALPLDLGVRVEERAPQQLARRVVRRARELLLDLADDGARDELGRELALRAVPVADHEERLALAGRAPHRVRDERAVLVRLGLARALLPVARVRAAHARRERPARVGRDRLVPVGAREGREPRRSRARSEAHRPRTAGGGGGDSGGFAHGLAAAAVEPLELAAHAPP